MDDTLNWLEGLYGYLQEALTADPKAVSKARAKMVGKGRFMPGVTDPKEKKFHFQKAGGPGGISWADRTRTRAGQELVPKKKGVLGRIFKRKTRTESRGYFGSLVAECYAVLEGGGAWNPADDDNTDKARAREREDRARTVKNVKTEGDDASEKKKRGLKFMGLGFKFGPDKMDKRQLIVRKAAIRRAAMKMKKAG